jgi:hypothetical protein
MEKFWPELNPFASAYNFYESRFILKPVEKTVLRTWKERLLKRPWNPFQKTKIITEWIPDPDLYIINGRDVYGHPATMARFRQEMNNANR